MKLYGIGCQPASGLVIKCLLASFPLVVLPFISLHHQHHNNNSQKQQFIVKIYYIPADKCLDFVAARHKQVDRWIYLTALKGGHVDILKKVLRCFNEVAFLCIMKVKNHFIRDIRWGNITVRRPQKEEGAAAQLLKPRKWKVVSGWTSAQLTSVVSFAMKNCGSEVFSPGAG